MVLSAPGASQRDRPAAHMGCDIHTRAPAPKSSTNFIRKCSTYSLGHGCGYECHSPAEEPSSSDSQDGRSDETGL